MRTDIKNLKKVFERTMLNIGRKLEGDSLAKNHEWQLFTKHLLQAGSITPQKFEKIKYTYFPKGEPKPKEYSELTQREKDEIDAIRKKFTNPKENNEK